MYNVSDEFNKRIKQSHTVVSRVDVYNGDTPLVENLEVERGYVHADNEAANRRRCDVVVGDPDMTPEEANDLLHPLSGNELHIHRGIRMYEPDTEELVPQGVFGIEDCNVDDQGESITISVKGFDRSKRIQRARWTDLYFVAEGTNVATAIRGILTNRMPDIDIAWVDTEVTTETTPPLVYGYGGWSGGGDPWEHASKLAESIGYELYFGVEGTCQLTPVPDPSVDPVVWTYQEGPDNLLLFGSRKLTRDNVFNHVIAFGLNTSTDEPIRVEATDDNPNSPTYIDGPFGDVPTYHRSTLLLTETQAQAAAEALLREKLGTPEQVRFISVVHPGHDIGDVVQIERERAGITGTHVIDKLSIPLGAMESMNATCRERRV